MSKVTKNAIVISLRKIMNKKALNKITINDITDECGINRMTFYYHFKDIYDLIEWIFIENIDRLIQNKKNCDTWQEGILNILKAIEENKKFILDIYNFINREQIECYLYGIVYNFIIDIVEEKCVDIIIDDEQKKFIGDFYKYAIVGVILNWVNDEMKDSSTKIVKYLNIILSGNIMNALNNYNLHKIHQSV